MIANNDWRDEFEPNRCRRGHRAAAARIYDVNRTFAILLDCHGGHGSGGHWPSANWIASVDARYPISIVLANRAPGGSGPYRTRNVLPHAAHGAPQVNAEQPHFMMVSTAPSRLGATTGTRRWASITNSGWPRSARFATSTRHRRRTCRPCASPSEWPGLPKIASSRRPSPISQTRGSATSSTCFPATAARRTLAIGRVDRALLLLDTVV